MIQCKGLETIEDFKSVKKGDFLAVEWKLDNYIGNKKTRFAVYQVYENLNDQEYPMPEIVLQKKNNVYFNYEMFCSNEGSVAKSVMLIQQVN